MKRIVYVAMALMLLVAASGQSAYAQKKVTPSKTQYAREALAPYVESGELPGAKAAETFFAQDFSNSTVDAYTGRTK